ncbi:MAG: hypothetical protein DHS20C21_24540 [Gemmatimonadota bacterium]|nr:MAG: hypothetical protein DHS20C21_24540 [Gemmatimonadota bacterium]
MSLDGSGDALSIQAGVDSSSAGDTVLVKAGEYVEGVSVTHGLSIIGESGAHATTLNRGGEGDCVVGFPAPGALLVEGLTLTGAQRSTYGSNGYGIVGGEFEVRSCVVETPYGVSGEGSVAVTDTEIRLGSGVALEHGDLTVERCSFVSNVQREGGSSYAIVQMLNGSATIRDCEFRDNLSFGGRPVVGYNGVPGQVVVEGCVFQGNSGPAVGWSAIAITAPRGLPDPDGTSVVVRGNTIVEADGPGLGGGVHRLSTDSVIEWNVIAGCDSGLVLPVKTAATVVSCNLSWGNGVNWAGFDDPTGTDGNLSEPPLFCDYAGGNYAPAGNSPLLPGSNSCGVQIGALGQGCGPVSVRPTSWARIKSLYRD